VLTGTGNGPFTALGPDAAGDIFTLPALTGFSPSGQADVTVTAAAITASSYGGDAPFPPSGQFLVATSVFGLARVNANGTLDASFGTGGTVTTSFNGSDGAGALLVQPDGKIVAIGSSENSEGDIFIALARYNA
jgi:Domain of unknown function (DUF5122) beta-propeller